MVPVVKLLLLVFKDMLCLQCSFFHFTERALGEEKICKRAWGPGLSMTKATKWKVTRMMKQDS